MFPIVGILVLICITDHIFHGGGLLPSAYGQVVRPPNFSPDAIPETSFTCEDKITGGYYADLEADCQLFHVCVQVSEYEVRKQEKLQETFPLETILVVIKYQKPWNTHYKCINLSNLL